jgi:endonuclease/exonuclease/phosphatase family metal-dependent hydrolase
MKCVGTENTEWLTAIDHVFGSSSALVLRQVVQFWVGAALVSDERI